jgi:DNA-binding response OmpR family regulator
VDDDLAVCRFLAELLSRNGLQAVTAATGAAAIARLREQSVPVLLFDLRLPDMDGIALIRQALDLDPRLFGVAVTGYGTIETAVEVMKAGAADFLAKPLQPEHVLASVRRGLELYRLRQEHAVLKGTVVKSSAVRLRSPRLTDFGQDGRVADPDGLTEFERGVAEGERRVREREGAAREREHQLLADVVRRLEQTIADLREAVEEDVRALAFAIATKIVRQAVETNRELVLDQVRAALAHVKDAPSVRVRVHPNDVPILEGARESLAGAREESVSLVVEGDPSVSVGGCVVQTPTRLVDATLESQLIRLGEALKRRSERGTVP